MNKENEFVLTGSYLGYIYNLYIIYPCILILLYRKC